MIRSGLKGRVSEIFKFKGINVNRASKMLGIPQRTLNRQVNEDGNVGMEVVYAIIDNFQNMRRIVPRIYIFFHNTTSHGCYLYHSLKTRK